MFNKITLLICGVFFLATDLTYALSCASPSPESILSEYDTVFVAFMTEAHFVEGEGGQDCGWVEGFFEVAEELKGNPGSVTVVRKKLTNCNGRRIAGASDSFPIGKYILVTTNREIAHFGSCASFWDDYASPCLIDDIRRRLDIDAPNEEARKSCVNIEKSRSEVSRVKGLRMYLKQLENERDSIESELKSAKERLAEAELVEE